MADVGKSGNENSKVHLILTIRLVLELLVTLASGEATAMYNLPYSTSLSSDPLK